MSDVPVLGDRERIARAIHDARFRWDGHGPDSAFDEYLADAVLAALPTPAQYLAGLAADDALVERVARALGRSPYEARKAIRALAAAVEVQP